MTLLRQHHTARIVGQHGEHPHGPALITERDIERRSRRQSVGAEPGTPAVVGHPLGHGEVRAAEGILGRRTAWVVQPAAGVGKEDHGLAAEHFRHVADRHAGHALDAAGHRELAAHRVQSRRTALAGAGDACLLPHVRGQRRDH